MIAELNTRTTDLERVFKQHPACEDSDVRDHICAVLQSVLIEGNLNTKIPMFFGVFNPVATMKLRKAVSRFVSTPSVRKFVEGQTLEARLGVLQSAMAQDGVRSRSGVPFTEILGEWV